MTLKQLILALRNAGSFFNLNLEPPNMAQALQEVETRLEKLEAAQKKEITPTPSP